MAITFEGIGAADSGQSSISPTIGTEDTADDIHVAFVANDGRQNQDAAPTGWTEKVSMVDANGSGTNATRHTVYWTRSDGSTADPTFTDTGNHTLGIIATFRGCIDTGDPFEAVSTSEESGSLTTDFSVTGLTSLTDGAMILSSSSSGDDGVHSNWANASLASITAAFTELTTSGSDSCVGMAYGIDTTAGTVSATTGDLSKSERYANIMLALEPAPTGVDHTATPAVVELDFTGEAVTIDFVDNHWIDVTEETLDFAGKVPTISVDQLPITVAPAIDTLALAGKVPTISVDQLPITVAPAIDTLALAGKAVTLDFVDHHTAAPAIDTLALAGKQPTISVDQLPIIVTPAVVELDLAPQAVTLDFVDHHTAAPAIDTLALAGKIPTISAGQLPIVATPAVVELDLAPQAVTLDFVDNHTATPAVVALDLAGKTPTAATDANHIALPAVVELDFAGQAVTLDFVDNHTAAPAVAELDLAPQAVTIVFVDNHIALPAVTTLDFTGQAVTLDFVDNHWITVGDGALVFAGQAPALVSGDSKVGQPGEVALVLAGKAVTVAWTDNHWIAVTEDTLALAGKVPTISVDQLPITVSPAVVALALSGKAGSIIVSSSTPVVAEPAVVALALAGQAPTIADADDIAPVPAIGTAVLAGSAPTRPSGLLFTGHVPTLGFSASRPLEYAATLTGQTPTLTNTTPVQDQIPTFIKKMALFSDCIAVEVGQETSEVSLQLATWIPVVTASSPTFFPPSVALALTGVAPISNDPDPPAGAAVLTGHVPTVVLPTNYALSPAVATLALTGKAPLAFDNTTLVSPPAVTLSLSNELVYTVRSIWIATRQLNFEGQAPTVAVAENTDISPAIDTLALAGKAPFVGVGPVAAPASVTVTIDGQAVTATTTLHHIVLPAVGLMRLVPYGVGGNVLGETETPQGAVVLAGKAPTVLTGQLILASATKRFVVKTVSREVIRVYQ
jgi:hypothetical protein